MSIPTKLSTPHARQEMDAHARRIANALALMEQVLPLRRRMLRAGDSVYRAGEHFANLHVIHSGVFKLVTVSADGREQVVALHFKGDWLGFDGIANGQHDCDAVAIDIGQVWTICYNTFLRACAEHPTLLNVLHTAMSQEMARDHDFMMSLCTLSADERVADFLGRWVGSRERRGLRANQMTLCMTRAEIGSYLGMTLESVSRAFSRLAREKLICFFDNGRRDLQIPDVAALSAFVQGSLSRPAVPCVTSSASELGVADVPLAALRDMRPAQRPRATARDGLERKGRAGRCRRPPALIEPEQGEPNGEQRDQCQHSGRVA